MKKETQELQVIETMRREGGYATLRRLNEIVDFSTWKTKTPEATVRRIVQDSKLIFKIQPGLWALEEFRDEVLRKFELKPGNKQSEEQFSHGYYQGLLVEIGKFRHQMTSSFYEVEHTTDIKNSLSKFYELQDFHADFHIVADASRKKEFEDKLHVSMFGAIEKRVKFVDYKRVADMYEGLTKVSSSIW